MFEALSGCLAAAKNGELFTASLVSAAWLVRMLPLLPDTGVLGAARVCLLRQLVLVLRSGKHGSDRALAMVALRSFMNDRGWSHRPLPILPQEFQKRERERTLNFLLFFGSERKNL